MKKTGKKVSALYIEIDRLQDEKIKEVWFFMDNANFISQLGVK
jgi:predicted ester cyclase